MRLPRHAKAERSITRELAMSLCTVSEAIIGVYCHIFPGDHQDKSRKEAHRQKATARIRKGEKDACHQEATTRRRKEAKQAICNGS